MSKYILLVLGQYLEQEKKTIIEIVIFFFSPQSSFEQIIVLDQGTYKFLVKTTKIKSMKSFFINKYSIENVTRGLIFLLQIVQFKNLVLKLEQ